MLADASQDRVVMLHAPRGTLRGAGRRSPTSASLRSVGATFVSLLFVVALAVHDIATRNKLHAATVLGGAFLIASRLIAVFVISASECGRAILRSLV
jgi:hypothetical protein